MELKPPSSKSSTSFDSQATLLNSWSNGPAISLQDSAIKMKGMQTPRRFVPDLSGSTVYRGLGEGDAGGYHPQPMEMNDQGATEDDFMQASELDTGHKYFPRQRFSRKSFRLDIKPFDGREIYRDLGANFIAWGRQLIDKMVKGEEEMGRWWTEQEKLMVLGDNLAGEAARYFQDNKDLWWNTSQSYQYALDQLAIAYSVRL
ncbi:MAG: hypothetical protein GY841_09455, partial [FCB group bacterium]|nr:hypothetical protein [FCB group bacterium]